MAKGFRPEKTIYKLEFEGTQYDGLVIRVGCCTIGEFNEEVIGSPDRNMKENNEALFGCFLKYLHSWNLERLVPGTKEEEWEIVPYTLEAINGEESTLMSHIIAAWQKAMVSISPNLRRPANSGPDLEQLELDLAKFSENQEN